MFSGRRAEGPQRPLPGAAQRDPPDAVRSWVSLVTPLRLTPRYLRRVRVVLRMIVGLVLTVAAFAVFGRRVWWLKRLAFSGQPAPERVAAVRSHPGTDVETQLTEVVGQRKLLQWSVPGAAHAATFWGVIVLLLTIIEAYGDLFSMIVSSSTM